TGQQADVKVFTGVYPTSDELLTRREHLPALAVVAVETRYLRADRSILASLFGLPAFVEAPAPLDPIRTVVLTLHGSVEGNETADRTGGSPSPPSVAPNHCFSPAPTAVAALVQWVRGPEGEQPTAVVNTGCFSSTRQRQGPTFNEELAALLAAQGGVRVY